MNTKKVGIVLLIISFALLLIFIYAFRDLTVEGEDLGCFNNINCKPVQRSLSLVHIGFGIFGFVLALAFYLLFLGRGDQEIVQHLARQNEKLMAEEKFSILLLGLDEFEKKVLQHIRSQPGITQNTLRLRTDMSKAKLSQILSGLEKKNLIARQQQGKTLSIFPKLDF